MISETKLPELAAFRKIEASVAFEAIPSYEGMFVSIANERLPVHRWFRFKESFSPDLLKAAIEDLRLEVGKSLRMLDPFCGVGTSLVAAQELQKEGYAITALGIERNPFMAFVAKTKAS